MSVAPDLLLKSAADVKPKTAPAKAPAKAVEPSNREASSFAQVYARERQAGTAERTEGPGRTGREAHAEAPATEEEAAAADAAAPLLAESGKPLPSESAEALAGLDASLLMGLSGQPALAEQPEALALQDGDQSWLPATASLVGPGPTGLTEASLDPQLDALNQLPAVRLALELGTKAQAQAQAQAGLTTAGGPGQAALAGGQGFAGAMAAMAAQRVQEEGLDAAGEPALEFAFEGLESLTESGAASRAESFAGKLSALSQAIGQPLATAPRAPLLPGQPLALQQGGWSEAVVDRVMWLSSQNLKSAEIQLDPAELGRLEVRVNVAQEQTQVTFASPNAGVREALEGQLHRLRELFSQQGMNLLDVNVSDQSLHRGWQGQEGDGRGRGNGAEPALGAGEEEVVGGLFEQQSRPGGRGLVDYYA